MRELFTQWAVYDVDGAVSQLNFILDTTSRNAAILGILGNPYLDRSHISPLYQRVEGVEARRMAAAQIYYQLRETDPAAAERYRRDAGISDEGDAGTIVVN